jgi:hypothetical protein
MGGRMKMMITALSMIAVLFVAGVSFADEDPHAALFTNKLFNGRFIVGLSDKDATIFIEGVIDGIGKAAPGTLSKIYPGCNREDVVVKVKRYYAENTDKIERPVADVLVGGCQ